MIIIATMCCWRDLSIQCIRSRSICFLLFQLTIIRFVLLANATSITMRSSSVILPSINTAFALQTICAAAHIADHYFLLPNCPLFSDSLCTALDNSRSITIFSRTVPMQLYSRIVGYVFYFMNSYLAGFQNITAHTGIQAAAFSPVPIVFFARPKILS